MDQLFNGDQSDDFNLIMAVASLFKEEFSIDFLISLLAEKKPSEILFYLEEGTNKGILTKTGPGCFTFTGVRKKRKRQAYLPVNTEHQLHGRIAEILMRELPDDDQKAAVLSHHLIKITNDLERCQYLAKAGDLHLKSFRTEDALQCYFKVLEDLENDEGEESDDLFSRTAIKYSKISIARHDTGRILSILRSALDRAEKWDFVDLQALLKMHMAKNEWLRSKYGKALRYFEEGWALAKKINDPGLLRAATTFSTFFLFWQGRFSEAIRMYEKSVPDIEKYPSGGFPLMAVVTVGYCYACAGQVTQALGMLDALRAQCLEKGDLYNAANIVGNIGNVLMDIGRTDDSLEYITTSIKEARQTHNDWVCMSEQVPLAYAYYLKGDLKNSYKCLQNFMEQRNKVQATVYLYPYLLEIGLAVHLGEYPSIEGLSIERDIQGMLGGKNVFFRGVAYRYQAALKKISGVDSEAVTRDLQSSIKWLKESGHEIELAKSRLELARELLAAGERDQAKELVLQASKVLSPLNDSLVPDDLRALIKDRPAGDDLLKEILKLGQEVVAIQDNRDLVQHIISTVNRVTGAERGAIFLLKNNNNPPELVLRASKNLTMDELGRERFTSSMQMIKEVALEGKGKLLGKNRDKEKSEGREVISSRICVPMILHDKTVGVLYHDNRLLSSAFQESDLELLSYFAALAAFALDNASAYEEIKRLNRKLSEETRYYKEEHLQSLHFEDIIGESRAIRRVLRQVDQVAGMDTTVLITGETGVGKELVARAIHRHSERRNKPFIRVHCSALPESLIPSELFGHEKGAFTGASKQRIGRFELADGGTLFLDEIGDISPDLQVRLLRVLQTKEFERVGGGETLRSDFRLVAATNRNLEKAVRKQLFRADLYYRLAVFPIYVPPLRERKEDIPLLAYYFLKVYSKKRGLKFSRITDGAMERLVRYDWPGNVRELENVIERGAILSTGSVFRSPELGAKPVENELEEENVTHKENERRHIISVLQKTGWKVRGKGGAAELLELPPSTLNFRMKKLGIRRPTK